MGGTANAPIKTVASSPALWPFSPMLSSIRGRSGSCPTISPAAFDHFDKLLHADGTEGTNKRNDEASAVARHWKSLGRRQIAAGPVPLNLSGNQSRVFCLRISPVAG